MPDSDWDRHLTPRQPFVIVRCSCRSMWTVSPNGKPMSWLGMMAEEYHRSRGHRPRKQPRR